MTRNPAGARVQAAYDSARGAEEAADTREASIGTPELNVLDPTSVRLALIQTMHDRRNTRGFRMEMLYLLGLLPCTNAQEMVFGPAADVREAFTWARANLARFPSESALVNLFYVHTERPPHWSGDGIGVKLVNGAADLVGALLRNRRIPTCTRFLLTY